MHNLNKQELKEVTGGLTLIELIILNDFAGELYLQGFEANPLKEWLQYFGSQVNNNNTISSQKSEPNKSGKDIQVVQTRMSNGDFLILTHKMFKIVHPG